MEETTPHRNCGLIAGPWAYGGAPLLGSRGKAMGLLRARLVQTLPLYGLQSERIRRVRSGSAEGFRPSESQRGGLLVHSLHAPGFPRHMSARCGRMHQLSPLLISHRVPCGLSHRTLVAARRHNCSHSLSPASWQSGGRNPDAEHRIWEPAQGVLGLGSQFSP